MLGLVGEIILAITAFILGYLVRRNNSKGIGGTEKIINYIDDVVEERLEEKLKDVKNKITG